MGSSTSSSSRDSSTASGEAAAAASDAAGAGRLTAWLRVALVAAGVVVCDQLSKQLVEHNITPGEEHKLLPGIELIETSGF